MLSIMISGLIVGSIYGLTAVGLVLTYKASGVFNFAHGALATVSAYAFYTLNVQWGLPWSVAALIVVLVLGPLMGLLFERFARSMSGGSLALSVAGTVGALLVIQAAVALLYGMDTPRVVPVFLAEGQVEFSGVVVQNSDLVTIAFAVLTTALLYVFFRSTRAGAAMRAVVERPDLLELSGTSATSVRRLSWVIGVCLASASGVLFSSLLPLDPVVLTLLVVQAFGAAAIGAFRSLPWSFVGGLIIGLMSSLASRFMNEGVLLGLPAAVPFIVLFLVLLFFPKRFLSSDASARPPFRPQWRAPAKFQLIAGAVVLGFLALVPLGAGTRLTEWTTAVASVVVFLSLGLLVRNAGQVSLGHVAFMAIGATSYAHLTVQFSWPWWAALVAAMVIAVPIGALLAIPAIRLSPLYLALATFGFAILVQFMFYTQDFMFGSTGSGVVLPLPDLPMATSRAGLYYVVLVITIAVAACVILLNHGRLGRLLRAVGDAPIAVATAGASTRVTWVLVFCLSAALAALSGAMSGMAQGVVSMASYAPTVSLSLLVVTVIALGGAPWYALMAAGVGILLPSFFTGYEAASWLQIVFGAFAIFYAVQPDDWRGTPPRVRQWVDRYFASAAPSKPADMTAEPFGTTVVPDGIIELENVTVRFGGIVAVRDVSMSAPVGQVTGLIGPNGAGKSTTFNVISGLRAPTSGRVLFDGRNINSDAPDARARAGIGRTFQQMQLFDSLSVRENVELGAEAPRAGRNPLRHLWSSRRDTKEISRSVREALTLCGIEALSRTSVGELSTGQRRMVELARALAGNFKVLLLDEPSSGLDKVETESFGNILKMIVEQRNIGIFLVEHDMSLVMNVCDKIYVLDFGQLIFEGSPDEAVASPIVRDAYLGEVNAELVVVSDDESAESTK